MNVYSRHRPQPPPPPIPGMALMGRRDGKGPGPLQRLLSRKKDNSECDGEVETTHINQVPQSYFGKCISNELVVEL